MSHLDLAKGVGVTDSTEEPDGSARTEAWKGQGEIAKAPVD